MFDGVLLCALLRQFFVFRFGILRPPHSTERVRVVGFAFVVVATRPGFVVARLLTTSPFPPIRFPIADFP